MAEVVKRASWPATTSGSTRRPMIRACAAYKSASSSPIRTRPKDGARG